MKTAGQAPRRRAPEVRFQYMVPAQVVRRRTACPVAYLPVGALEWHGSHLPFGTDAMTVEHIAVQAARRAGGVVFPPVLYGDCRYRLQEHRPEWRESYAREMRLELRRTALFGYGTQAPVGYRKGRGGGGDPVPLLYDEQMTYLVRHLAYVLLEIAMYGFEGIVLLPGHGPTTGPCQDAANLFQQSVKRLPALRPAPWVDVFAYLVACREIEPALQKHWVHADKIETSLLAVVEPATVQPSRLPRSAKKIPPSYLGGDYLDPRTGYREEYRELWDSFDAMDPRRMSKAYGRRILEFSAAQLAERVRGLSSAQPSGSAAP